MEGSSMFLLVALRKFSILVIAAIIVANSSTARGKTCCRGKRSALRLFNMTKRVPTFDLTPENIKPTTMMYHEKSITEDEIMILVLNKINTLVRRDTSFLETKINTEGTILSPYFLISWILCW